MLTGYLPTLPDDTMLSAGVLYATRNGVYQPIGVTDGAPDYDAGIELGEIMFDNRAPSRLKGLTRRVGVSAVIKGTAKEFGSSTSGGQIALWEPGSSENTASGITTVTPKRIGAMYAPGDYLVDFRWIFERASGGYACIYAPCAIVRKWGNKGQDKKEAQFAFEIECIGDPVNDLGLLPYTIERRLALPTGTPTTPQALVAAVNALGATLITHAWAPGLGHTTTVGQKASIADFVGGGSDGVLNLVPSFGTGGFSYDPATPDRWTYGGVSMKAALPSDGSLAGSKSFGFIGKLNNDPVYFMQSHDGAGGGEIAHQFNANALLGWKKTTATSGSSNYSGIAKDGSVRLATLQYDQPHDEMQMIAGRDSRSWGSGGGNVGYTGARTLEVGNQFGGSNVNNATGDVRFVCVANGLLSQAQIDLIHDYAVAHCGVVEDTRPHVIFSGNSLVSNVIAGAWAEKLRAALGTGYVTSDLGWSGAKFSDLQARAARLDQFMGSNGHRPKIIYCFYEWTNTIDTSYTGTSAYALDKSTIQAIVAVMLPTVKKVGITMLPNTLHAAYGSADDTTIENTRVAANALLLADAYWDGICNAGGDATMGNHANTQNTSDYSDGTHPTSAGGDIDTALLKTTVVAL